MSIHKLMILAIIFGLSFIFLVLTFRRKKDDGGVDWNKVKLNDTKDRAYSLPSDDASSIQNAKQTILYNARASRRVDLTTDWLNSLDSLVRAAYTIYRNSDSPQYAPSTSTYPYFKMLYYRSNLLKKQSEAKCCLCIVSVLIRLELMNASKSWHFRRNCQSFSRLSARRSIVCGTIRTS